MSHSSFANAFAASEIDYRAKLLKQTWGNLAPKRDKTYKGHILFAVGCFGDDPLNPTILESEFRGLDSSPWFFDALSEFLSADQHCAAGRCRFRAGCVYRFDGTFRNYIFKGSLRVVILTAGPQVK